MTQILVLAFIVFWFFKDHLNTSPTISLDTDWFYRKPARVVEKIFVNFPNSAFGKAEQAIYSIAESVSALSKNPIKVLLPVFVSEGRDIESDGFSTSIGASLSFILFGFIVVLLVILM
ncbi:MAG: hypothetical protein U5K71_05080 [Gracilimonas sp.]|nr:hypothetical protein [Gracilimonas sp.]